MSISPISSSWGNPFNPYPEFDRKYTFGHSPPSPQLDCRSQPSFQSPLSAQRDDDDIYDGFDVPRQLKDEKVKKPSPPVLPQAPVCPKLLTIDVFEDSIPEELLKEDSKSEQPFFADHVCGINWFAVRDPVYDVRFKGHIYERKTILEWLKYRKISPLNQGPMTESDLADDVELKSDIDRRLNDWIAKQNAPILERHREAVRLHEKNVQEILARHNEAMQRYESAIKAQDESDEKEQIPEGDFVEEPRNIPYGAGLARLRSKEEKESADLKNFMGLYKAIGDGRNLEQEIIPTALKVQNVADGLFSAMAGASLASLAPIPGSVPRASSMGGGQFAKMHDVAECVSSSQFSYTFDRNWDSKKPKEEKTQEFLDDVLASLERAKRAS